MYFMQATCVSGKDGKGFLYGLALYGRTVYSILEQRMVNTESKSDTDLPPSLAGAQLGKTDERVRLSFAQMVIVLHRIQ